MTYKNTNDLFRDTRVIMADRFEVFSWSPRPAEEKAPVTEVHIVMQKPKAPGYAFVFRLKSRAVCKELIAALQKHMDDVWPER